MERLLLASVSTALLDTGRRTFEGGDDGGADIVVDALARLPCRLFAEFEIRSDNAGPLQKYTRPIPQSAASVAAAAGDAAALESLPVAELDEADPESGNTPLIWAADAGHEAAVKVLLRKGVSCNLKGFLGATAVARACRAGHVSALAALLEAPGEGAQPPVQKGRTASWWPSRPLLLEVEGRPNRACGLAPRAPRLSAGSIPGTR